jgi:hypothetical protein
MYLDVHVASALGPGSERDAIESMGPTLAPLFESDLPRERTGLLVASANAGVATSLQFWAGARRVGLALASPEHFPWCLANASCGALARRFGVTGPNFTMLGAADAMLGAIETTTDYFALGRMDMAVVVVVVPQFAAEPDDRGRLFAFRLMRQAGPIAIRAEATAPSATCVSLGESVETLIQLLRQIESGSAVAGSISDGHRAFRLERTER